MPETFRPHFAERTDFGPVADAIGAAVSARRSAGRPVLDLSQSNPTVCGLGLPADAVLVPLANPAGMHYRAEPMGSESARQAIASLYYGQRGIAMAAGDLMLTASTSEAYSYLFRLLCDPGDQVLVPEPGYPLFDLLAQLGDVQVRTYPLRFHDGWQIDLYALESAITDRTRAIVVVHPNNPTGHYASDAERYALERLAAKRNLALLVDEVFLDYHVAGLPGTIASFAGGPEPGALTFVMSGLSKVLALPQMKLAWTAVRGPERLRQEALHRLEFVADTFLSVSAPVANAAAAWLARSGEAQATVLRRVRTNLLWLREELASHPLVRHLPVEGGWSVLLRLPATGPDEDFCLRLLVQRGVLVQPGSFSACRRAAMSCSASFPRSPSFRRGYSP